MTDGHWSLLTGIPLPGPAALRMQTLRPHLGSNELESAFIQDPQVLAGSFASLPFSLRSTRLAYRWSVVVFIMNIRAALAIGRMGAGVVSNQQQTETSPENSLSRQNLFSHLTYFARLTWPETCLAYVSGNHKQNLNYFPKWIGGNHCSIHLREF